MSLTQVRALAEEYANKYNSENVAPFPYENITDAHKDLRIYFTALEDDNVSGAILFRDDEFNILVNNNKSAARQHFTLAHELAHYFLHQDSLRAEQAIIDGGEELEFGGLSFSNQADNDTEIRENEANNFAASLIMPTDLVRRAWEASGSIQECARIFEVSPIAMSIRLTWLGLIRE